MAQANWYAFGRLAWNHELSSDSIANEWVKMTWSWNPTVISTICTMMAGSREAVVKFQEPLGMGYLCGSDHYSPAPGTVQNASYPSYNPTYWHKADAVGLATTGNPLPRAAILSMSIFRRITPCIIRYRQRRTTCSAITIMYRGTTSCPRRAGPSGTNSASGIMTARTTSAWMILRNGPRSMG